MNDAEIAHVAAVVTNAEIVLYKMIEAVQIKIGKHLAGEVRFPMGRPQFSGA